MLRLIERLAYVLPAPWHRAGLQLAYRLRKRLFRAFAPDTCGVSVILTDAEGRVLLVRHGYGPGLWAVPGGGMKRGEDPIACARREMAEELSCTIADIRMVAIVHEKLFGAHHTAHLVAGTAVEQPQPDNREIVAARYFALDGLPDDSEMLAITRARLTHWLEALEQR